MSGLLERARPALALLAAAGLALGLALKLAGFETSSNIVWAAVTVPVLAALLAEIVTSLAAGAAGLKGSPRLPHAPR